MLLRPRFWWAVAVLAAISPTTHAADGVVEINQTCAVGPGCFAGDLAGLPVTITGAAGRSYRLTSDLVVTDSATNVISISASNTSVDLGGFRISGPNTCSGSPTTCTASGSGAGIAVTNLVTITGVEVSNGSVVGIGGHGINLGPGTVHDVRASMNGGNGIGLGSPGSVVTGSVGSSNGASGIVAGTGSTVSASSAARNADNGISVGSGSTVTGSTAFNNFGSGIAAGQDSTVVGSTASAKTSIGIFVQQHSTVTGSTGSNNGDNGISVSLFGTITGCTASGNDGDGILTTLSGHVIGNTVGNNGGAGLSLGDRSAYRENVIVSNTGGTVILTTGAGTFTNLGNNHCTNSADAIVACP